MNGNLNPYNLCKNSLPQVIYTLDKKRKQTFVNEKDDAISAYTGMHMI